MNKMSQLYFDYNSTTPYADEVKETIVKTMNQQWANPSSNYNIGQKAKQIVQDSRNKVAKMIHSNDDEITFTSGGTESNNWIINSMINSNSTNNVPHIITSNIEHDSISKSLEHYQKCGKITVSYIPVSTLNGTIDCDLVINSIRPETCLITIMLANNETGVIQPIKDIALKLEMINQIREEYNNLHKVYFHTDAAQAFGKIKVDVNELMIDYMTIVGHKFYGPRIGALYHKKDAPLEPMLFGGGQEDSLRPGTENTPMITGLGKAAELVYSNIDYYHNHFLELRDYFESELKSNFKDLIKINFCDIPFGKLPNTISLTFIDDNLTGINILQNTSRLKASLGAACHSKYIEKGRSSQILIKSGLDQYSAERTLRLSLGRETTKNEIDEVINELKLCIDKIKIF